MNMPAPLLGCEHERHCVIPTDSWGYEAVDRHGGTVEHRKANRRSELEASTGDDLGLSEVPTPDACKGMAKEAVASFGQLSVSNDLGGVSASG